MDFQKEKIGNYEIGFIILLIINSCFYNLNTMTLYIGLGGVAVILILGIPLFRCIRLGKMIVKKGELWITLIYSIFLTYGLLFLKASEFQADFMFFTYVSNIALLVSFRKIIQSDKWTVTIARVFAIGSSFVVLYLVLMERDLFGTTGIRIGSTLSGNVNTVGACLGIMSIFLSFVYTKSKSKLLLVLYLATSVIMLLTGSKKTIVYLTLSLVVYLFYSNKKIKRIIVVLIAISFFYYLIMNVPYFYSVIGRRIDGMIAYMKGSNDIIDTYSTMERRNMINEGIKIFLEKPIFGGGQGYFALRSSSGYGYSHCNYIELLCNFGIIGTALFYMPLLYNFCILFRARKVYKDYAILGCSLIVSKLFVDWMMVSYSSISLYYLPVIASFVFLERIEENDTIQCIS